MLPYDSIIERGDRSYTHRLLARWHELDEGDTELRRVERALASCSDPRSVEPLEAVVVDPSRPEWRRRSVSKIFEDFQIITDEENETTVRPWWDNGDRVLREYALLEMDGLTCPDIIREVAADPAHPLQAHALRRMDFWFGNPSDHRIEIDALDHPDPEVRISAAWVLLWDEPVAAEDALIRATMDDDLRVVAEAANTLEYYPTQRVYRTLRELLDHPDDGVREDVQDSFECIESRMLDAWFYPDRAVRNWMREWLEPIRDLIPNEQPAAESDRASKSGWKSRRTRAEPTDRIPIDYLLEQFDNPDLAVHEFSTRLDSNDWRAYSLSDRERIREVGLTHADRVVREWCINAFGAWQDYDSLTALLSNQPHSIRKTAMYALSQLPRNEALDDIIWDYLCHSKHKGAHTTESLNCYVQHGNRKRVRERLFTVAFDDDQSENVRCVAIGALAAAQAIEEVRQLAKTLREPPAVTWALHIELIEAMRGLGNPIPDLPELREVDSLDLQLALAEAQA